MGREQAQSEVREAVRARRGGGLESARSGLEPGGPLPAQARFLLSLQRSAGNRAVTGLVQGRSAPVQRESVEEEEPLQGRFEGVQRQAGEDEEELQMKAASSAPDEVPEQEADVVVARAADVGELVPTAQLFQDPEGRCSDALQRVTQLVDADENTLWDAYFTAYNAKMDPATKNRRDDQWHNWLQLFHNFETSIYLAKNQGGGTAYAAAQVQDRYETLVHIGLRPPAAVPDANVAAANTVLQVASTRFGAFRGNPILNRGAWAGSNTHGGRPPDYAQTAQGVITTLRQRQVANGGKLSNNWWIMQSDTAPSGFALHGPGTDARGDFIYHL